MINPIIAAMMTNEDKYEHIRLFWE